MSARTSFFYMWGACPERIFLQRALNKAKHYCKSKEVGYETCNVSDDRGGLNFTDRKFVVFCEEKEFSVAFNLFICHVKVSLKWQKTSIYNGFSHLSRWISHTFPKIWSLWHSTNDFPLTAVGGIFQLEVEGGQKWPGSGFCHMKGIWRRFLLF